jgi:hypothetical protein
MEADGTQDVEVTGVEARLSNVLMPSCGIKILIL